MTIIPYKLTGRRLLVLFATPLFSLFVFQPAPPAMAARADPCAPSAVTGRLARLLLSRRSRGLNVSGVKNTPQIRVQFPGRKKSEKEKKAQSAESKAKIVAEFIAKTGPEFPAVFSMSSFSVKGFVKGRWPIVIDYELETESTAVITISAGDKQQPFIIELPPTNDERKEVIRQLPEAFGQNPQVGVLSFQALKNGTGERRPARFFLYGLGVGPDAVGSMVVDQLQFQPGQIRPKLKEKATYSFRALSDFETGSADFMLIVLSSDGVVRSQLAASEPLKNGVRRGESVMRDWDGKNRGRISQGPHRLRVRVWRGLKSGGDWVFAFTRQEVRVE